MRSLAKLIFWLTMWLFTWIIVSPFRKSGEHNCITYALNRWENEGGYFVIRWARNAKYPWLTWPHCLWLPPEHHQHLVSAQAPIKAKRALPLLLFNPNIEFGDAKNGEE